MAIRGSVVFGFSFRTLRLPFTWNQLNVLLANKQHCASSLQIINSLSHESVAQYLWNQNILWLLLHIYTATVNAFPQTPCGTANPTSRISTTHGLSGISLWIAGCCTSPVWSRQTNTMSSHSWRAKRCLLPFRSPWKQPNTQPALPSASAQHTAVHVW